MFEISFNEVIDTLEKEPVAIVYLSAPQCSVCHAVKPRVEALFTDKVPMFHLDVVESPEAAGHFLALTAPVVLLFSKGKEVHRQARFIDFHRLEEIATSYLDADDSISYEDLFR